MPSIGFGRRVRRTRRGDFELRLPGPERDLLRSLPEELRQMLDTDDPALTRLFPPAYQDDPVRDEEYSRLVHDDLLAGKLSSVGIMEATIDADRVDEEQLTAWLGAINDLRLIMGSRLGVTEEMYERDLARDDPRTPQFALFTYLGWLEEQVVQALASGIDPAGTERA